LTLDILRIFRTVVMSSGISLHDLLEDLEDSSSSWCHRDWTMEAGIARAARLSYSMSRRECAWCIVRRSTESSKGSKTQRF
jgi:hypothetical protein